MEEEGAIMGLPSDIWFDICTKYLNVKDIYNLGETCKQLREYCIDVNIFKVIWRNLIANEIPEPAVVTIPPGNYEIPNVDKLNGEIRLNIPKELKISQDKEGERWEEKIKEYEKAPCNINKRGVGRLHKDEVLNLATSYSGKFILTCSRDCKVALWDIVDFFQSNDQIDDDDDDDDDNNDDENDENDFDVEENENLFFKENNNEKYAENSLFMQIFYQEKQEQNNQSISVNNNNNININDNNNDNDNNNINDNNNDKNNDDKMEIILDQKKVKKNRVKPKWVFKCNENIGRIEFSPDDKKIIACCVTPSLKRANPTYSIYIINSKNGEKLNEIFTDIVYDGYSYWVDNDHIVYLNNCYIVGTRSREKFHIRNINMENDIWKLWLPVIENQYRDYVRLFRPVFSIPFHFIGVTGNELVNDFIEIFRLPNENEVDEEKFIFVKELRETGGIMGYELSKDGKYLIANVRPYTKFPSEISMEFELHLWNLPTFQLVRVFKGHSAISLSNNSFINFAAISDNYRYVASGDEKGMISIWYVDTGKMVKRWLGHENIVNAVSFLRHPFDENRLLLSSCSDDFTLKIWR